MSQISPNQILKFELYRTQRLKICPSNAREKMNYFQIKKFRAIIFSAQFSTNQTIDFELQMTSKYKVGPTN